jgi:hypothetical protein
MTTKIRKAHLRQCARKALEDRGYSVEDIGGPGVVPGARLRVSKESKTFTVAVRTSLDRKVGLVRNSDGAWMTVPSVARLVVAAPSAADPNCAEVLAFTSKDIVEAFSQELATREKRKPDFSPKAPIFLALDASGPGRVKKGLKTLASWHCDVPLASVSRQQGSNEEGITAFIARVKREFVQQFNLEEKNVKIVIRMKG